MKRKTITIVLVFLTVLTIFGYLFLKRPNSKKNETYQATCKPYFVPVSISKFSSIQAPCLDVQIGNETFSMELDLGMRGALSISTAYIDRVISKQFVEDQPRYGFRGKEYQTNFYQISDISIGDMFFIRPILQESCEEFCNDSVIIKKGNTPSPREHGRLGWELFYNVNLLIDIKKSQIAFCDSINTLKKQGYPVGDFVKAPLLIERGLIEFETQVSERSFCCLLDTGCTKNLVNSEAEEGKSIEDIIFDPNYVVEYPSFKISETEFGPIKFHRIPIKMPIQIDMVLGMEFFENFLVFIDFSNRHVYFSKQSIDDL